MCDSTITPLPWKVDREAPFVIRDAGGDRVAVPSGFEHTFTQPEANAAYIVRACNSYPTMVELLEAIKRLATVELNGTSVEYFAINRDDIRRTVDAALRLAKEGQ